MIIAGVAALAAYAAFGSQTPFSFLHHAKSGHDHSVSITVDTDDESAAPAIPAIPKIPAIPEIPAIPPIPPVPGMATGNAESRSLAPFDSIVLEDGAAADITIGDEQSVQFTVPGGHGEGLTTDVKDGKLAVAGMGPAAHLKITVPHLRSLQVNGPSKVSIGGLKEPIAITASGTVDSAELTVNGPSKLSLTELVAKNVSVRLNGVGAAEVNATQTLTADVEGVGHVRYLGDPRIISTIHGTGWVKRMADAG